MLVEIMKNNGNEKAVVSSLDVSLTFEKEHKHVLRDIENIIDQSKIGPMCHNMFYKADYKDGYGRKQPMYVMDRDGFTLLVMGFTGAKSLQFKLEYIKLFNKMEAYIANIEKERANAAKKWEIERAKGVLLRNMFTDAIKNKIADSPHKKFAYSNYTKLAYKILYGVDINKMRDFLHIGNKDNIRDSISAENLEEIQQLEHLMAGLINMGWDYKKIKEFLEANYPKSDLLPITSNTPLLNDRSDGDAGDN